MELCLHPDSKDDYYVKLNGTMYQSHLGRGKDYTVTFRAKGNGKLSAGYYRYHYTPKTKAMRYIALKNELPSIKLTDDWKVYRYEVHKQYDDEIFAPVFTSLSGEVCIDDVKITDGPRLLYHDEIKVQK